MPTYAYEALNPAGRPQKGTVEASDTEGAILCIKSQGYFPTSVKRKVADAKYTEERIQSYGTSTRTSFFHDPFVILCMGVIGFVMLIGGSCVGNYLCIGKPHRFFMAAEYPLICQIFMGLGVFLWGSACFCRIMATRRSE